MGDYSDALSIAKAFDSKLSAEASAISENYAGVVALSVRQALGALEITISKTAEGAWNTSDVMVFLKGTSHTHTHDEF